jgi:hypothetical protein
MHTDLTCLPVAATVPAAVTIHATYSSRLSGTSFGMTAAGKLWAHHSRHQENRPLISDSRTDVVQTERCPVGHSSECRRSPLGTPRCRPRSGSVRNVGVARAGCTTIELLLHAKVCIFDQPSVFERGCHGHPGEQLVVVFLATILQDEGILLTSVQVIASA